MWTETEPKADILNHKQRKQKRKNINVAVYNLNIRYLDSNFTTMHFSVDPLCHLLIE